MEIQVKDRLGITHTFSLSKGDSKLRFCLGCFRGISQPVEGVVLKRTQRIDTREMADFFHLSCYIAGFEEREKNNSLQIRGDDLIEMKNFIRLLKIHPQYLLEKL